MAKRKRSTGTKYQSNAIKKQYSRQTRRIKEAIRRAEKAGFEVEYQVLPPTPKRVTEATIRRLERITPKSIKEKSRFIDRETGEILSGQQGIALRRSQAAQKRRKPKPIEPIDIPTSQELSVSKPELPEFSTVVISNFKLHISYFNLAAQALCMKFLDSLLSTIGPDKTAEILEHGKNNGNWLEPKVAYNLDLLSDSLADMLNYTDASPEDRAAILEEIDDEFDIDSELYM